MSERETAPSVGPNGKLTPAEPTQPVGTIGEEAVRSVLVLGGPPDAGVIADVLARFPGDRDAILVLLHQTLGNSFVKQVLALAHGDERTNEPSALDPLRDQQIILADSTPTTTGPAAQKPASDATALLGRHPTTTRGPDGHAAWLLLAHTLGYVRLAPFTRSQLEDLAANRPVHTREYRAVSQAKEDLRNAQTKGKLDNVSRTGGAKGPGDAFDIDLVDAPILETLVGVARSRIARATGGNRVVLDLGDFVRADLWFTPPGHPENAAPHEPGTAIDLHFVGKANTEGDVVDLLNDIPQTGSLTVVRDSNDAIHLDVRNGGYGLGIPATGDFIASELAIDDVTGRNVEQQRQELKAGADPSRTLEAKGIRIFSGQVLISRATWKDGKWQWSAWSQTGESVVSHIRSAKVRKAITEFGKAKPSQPAKHHETERL